jgi:dienelactone hydrolase
MLMRATGPRVSPALAVKKACRLPRLRKTRTAMKNFFLIGMFSLAAGVAPEGWPQAVREVRYLSQADNTKQPALFYRSPTDSAQPLLVGLHSWSDGFKQTLSVPYANWCIEKGWNFIHPNFRGPNRGPEATGSELVVQDILSAVEYAKEHAKVDESRIYLVGVSGGGHAALLMAGRSPDTWAGVSAWVPILDLARWHAETTARKLRYAPEIEASIGGKPVAGSKAEAEARKRSASTYLARAKGVPVDINAGITDGHNGSVPVSHSLEAFNLLAAEKDRITAEQMAEFVRTAKVPESITDKVPEDETYGAKRVLFRRKSGAARVTIFQGGHEIIAAAALQWLAQQQNVRVSK